MHERPALSVGEHRAVDVPAVLIGGEDERAAWPAQRLVSRAGDDLGVRRRRRVDARGDEPGDVRHVDHEDGAHLVGDLAEASEVDGARVGRVARDDDLRPPLAGNRGDDLVVELLGLGVETVRGEVIELRGEVDLAAVCEVPALVEAEAHDVVAGRQQGSVRLHVGAGARVGLDIGVFDAEQLLGAVDGELLGDVDELAAAVVAAAGVALGVLVGERRACASRTPRLA